VWYWSGPWTGSAKVERGPEFSISYGPCKFKDRIGPWKAKGVNKGVDTTTSSETDWSASVDWSVLCIFPLTAEDYGP